MKIFCHKLTFIIVYCTGKGNASRGISIFYTDFLKFNFSLFAKNEKIHRRNGKKRHLSFPNSNGKKGGVFVQNDRRITQSELFFIRSCRKVRRTAFKYCGNRAEFKKLPFEIYTVYAIIKVQKQYRVYRSKRQFIQRKQPKSGGVGSMRKKEMIAMLLAGGQGSRLGILTRKVAKPAVAYGGTAGNSGALLRL